MMRLKFATVALVGTILVLLTATGVQAIEPDISINPETIPPNGTVTITITGRGDSTYIHTIKVIGPGPTRVSYEMNPLTWLRKGETLEVSFGTDVDGWSPKADTSREGLYEVFAAGWGCTFCVRGHFHCTSVPEFSVASIALASIGFAALNMMRKFNRRSKP